MRRSTSEPGGHCCGENGFALLLVIWGLGLIALIALAVIVSGRHRILATANLIDLAYQLVSAGQLPVSLLTNSLPLEGGAAIGESHAHRLRVWTLDASR